MKEVLKMFKLKVIAVFAFIVLLLVSSLIPVGVEAQGYNQTPPRFCCGPSYSYGAAKAHKHSRFATIYGSFADNGLVLDKANNPGNNFFGNTIQIRGWGPRKTYWYDWSADQRAAEKLAVWRFSWWEILTVTYDPDCMMVIKITSPQFPAASETVNRSKSRVRTSETAQ